MNKLALVFNVTVLLVCWQVQVNSSEAININTQPVNQSTETLNIDNSPQNLIREENNLVTRLVIKLSERKVYAYQEDIVLASYPIAIGKKGWETPMGNYAIIQMIKNPSWEHPWNGNIIPPGPENPLGDRWIGFWTDGKNFIGFHGTPAEQLVGQAVSHGCVRMRNNDVRVLFEKVAVGTPVIVQP